MASFTPGPWEAIGTDPAEGGDWFWISGSNRMIGTVNGSQSDETQAANARLIAAAPDMFALLQAIDDMWSDDGEGCRADPVDARSGKVREIWQQMRDTLAQARGNSI